MKRTTPIIVALLLGIAAGQDQEPKYAKGGAFKPTLMQRAAFDGIEFRLAEWGKKRRALDEELENIKKAQGALLDSVAAEVSRTTIIYDFGEHLFYEVIPISSGTQPRSK